MCGVGFFVELSCGPPAGVNAMEGTLKEETFEAFDLFLNTFAANHSAAVECLGRVAWCLLFESFRRSSGVTFDRKYVCVPCLFAIESQRTMAVQKRRW
jgi:hypothetical protein